MQIHPAEGKRGRLTTGCLGDGLAA
jgi:hypothetical protein